MSEMNWDLSQLVDDTDAGSIIKKLEQMVEEAGGIEAKYKGNIEKMGAKDLYDLLGSLDAFSLKFEGPADYCRLLYSSNSLDPIAKRLNEAVRKAGTRAGQQLAFLEIELGRLLSSNASLIDDPVLADYKHFLERRLRVVPHLLTEEEERIVMAKDQNGVDAWSQLQGDWLSTRMFKLTVDGEEKTLPYGEIVSYYQSNDRDVRLNANRSVFSHLGQDEILWSSAIRSVCADHLEMCRLRKYPTPLTQSLIANDIEQDAVDALMSAVKKNVGLYHRYLRTKAKAMGLERLGNWDLIAPLPNTSERSYSWDASRKEIVEAYSSFDKEFGTWIGEMFDKNHIDGEVRKGKVSGAFCATWFGGRSAFILQSFNGRMSDVYTQAHELGHAIHAYLGSRAQRPSNYEIGSCIAECGSIFGELLLTEQLLKGSTSKEERRAILTIIMDEFGMTAFQVSARFFFEKSMYEAIEKGTFLDGEMVSQLWSAARDDIYGDAVEWLPEMKWEWTMKLHYYIPNYRFYNYPYVFAQLFVFSLYRLYKEQGEEFVPKLKSLLSAGSSRSPKELGRELGFDITDESFWQKGMDQAEEFLKQLEEMQ